MSRDLIVQSILTRAADLAIFDGGWRSICIRELPAGEHADVSAADTEAFLFLLEGRGRLRLEDADIDVPPRTAVTLALGTHAVLAAVDSGLRFFEARIAPEQ